MMRHSKHFFLGAALLALTGCGGPSSEAGGGVSYAALRNVSWQEMTYDIPRGKQLLQADGYYIPDPARAR